MSAVLSLLLAGACGTVAIILGSVLLLFPDRDFTPEPHEAEQ